MGRQDYGGGGAKAPQRSLLSTPDSERRVPWLDKHCPWGALHGTGLRLVVFAETTVQSQGLAKHCLWGALTGIGLMRVVFAETTVQPRPEEIWPLDLVGLCSHRTILSAQSAKLDPGGHFSFHQR